MQLKECSSLSVFSEVAFSYSAIRAELVVNYSQMNQKLNNMTHSESTDQR
jgi:hypothetical protein